MSWLSKLFKSVPKEERNGIKLDLRVPTWKVSSPKEFPAFLHALIDLIPNGSIAYLEGGSPRKELKAFLDERSVPEVSHVAMGTIWPRPHVFHLPATPENLSALADISERYAEPEVAIHFHVYKDDQILLQWYDAFCDPIFISNEVPEYNVKEFCTKLSLKYEIDTLGVESGSRGFFSPSPHTT